MFVLYKLTSKTSGKSYIGYSKKTLNERWDEHQREARRSRKKYKIHYAIRKYGANDFLVEQIDETITLHEALQKEIELISKYNTFYDGYNMTLGGETPSPGMKGKHHTTQSKKNISKSLTDKPKSEEHKQAMKENHADFTGSANPFFGKTHTEKAKEKIGQRSYENQRGKRHYLFGKAIPTSFRSGEEHPRSLGITIEGVRYGSLRQAATLLHRDRKILRKLLPA